ncbi:ABC transporter substrate-binding protein [Roseburia sp. NSJ-9]|jgi:raffinose/stachyose/melibiose transport system substrate-binding protein|uniref:ABC transporter substrate-binding protein n=1 Tax=Roseburia lenta TaxID=2763061 RepID=A0ABR7GFG4_9FIRM|nr:MULTISPECIES: ABC transporter substrate-binding protein [Roseburia]MBC5686189.1 ABC transporter substrate-binding protein [Roseburia lenta]RHO33304.1 extracellular solute-binding protein [Roseburia sp. AM16-25]
MKLKKVLALTMVATMAVGAFVGCGNSKDGGDSAKSDSGKVYYLNFKPEADDAWQALAKEYTKETGVDVTVVTAASNKYEETLMAEMSKSEAPTLFHVNGPVGLKNWKDYAMDLSDTDVYKNLNGDEYALKDGDEVKGIAMAVETYGIITNTKLLKEAGYTVDDIQSFDDLKKVAEDITARKDELGFAAFTSAGMDDSSDWRFKTHLSNLPIYFEYQDENETSTDAIKGTYLDNYKNIFDLYINNSTCDPKELASKTGDDSEAEFINGEAVFFQNGSWEYGNVVGDKKLSADDVTMIPIYIGVGDEANQGLCTGTENYWCVNSAADEKDIQATLDFMNWCVSSDKGTTAMADDMGFVIPFKDAKDTDNVFVQKDKEMQAAGKTTIPWDFTTIPSEQWKADLSSALTAYAAGTGSWDDVKTAFVDGWAKEYKAANQE